jgi:hypothetical protein
LISEALAKAMWVAQQWHIVSALADGFGGVYRDATSCGHEPSVEHWWNMEQGDECAWAVCQI